MDYRVIGSKGVPVRAILPLGVASEKEKAQRGAGLGG